MENKQRPTILIENVETLNVTLSDLAHVETNVDSVTKIPDTQKPKKPPLSERIYQVLDVLAKLVSVLTGISLIVLLVLIFLNVRQIGNLEISNLLTIISFTFIGGIFSIGGLNLINLQANLKKQKSVIDKLGREETLTAKTIGSTSLNRGWHHFLFPSKNLLFVYGHECEAQLYRFDIDPLQCKGVWNYSEATERQNSFVQTATHYKDELLAVGDYATGAVIIYDLKSSEFYNIAPMKSVVSSLMFSPDGKQLLISYGHVTKIDSVFVHNTDKKYTKTLHGSAPTNWINNSTVAYVKNDKQLCVYDITNETEQVIHTASHPIKNIASDGDIIVFAETVDETRSEKQLTNIYIGRLNDFHPETISRTECPLEQLEIVNGMLFIATSWNGSLHDTRKFYIQNLDGELVSEFTNDSGHGHGYPKYAYLDSGDSVFVSTTGINGFVPVVDLTKNRRMTLKRDSSNSSFKETWISVQINENEDKHMYLSLLSHDGIFALYDVSLNKQNKH